MHLPYIGVTDFTSHSQVLEAVACISKKVNRRLHVGAMISYKTLHGIKTETGWENIWLKEEGLRNLFQPHPKVFNVLHYADYGKPCLTTSEDLIVACQKAGPYLNGLQLDMIWPHPRLLMDVKQAFPHLEIIVQISKKAIDELNTLVINYFTYKLRSYLLDASYFLIDYSMGRGEPMDIPFVLRYLRKANETIPFNKLAVGGGLGPETYHPLEEIVELSPSISWDAQGQMRASGNATDPIEMSRVCAYIKRTSSLLS